MRRMNVAVTFILASGLLARSASGTVYYGCYVCDPVDLTSTAAVCRAVGDDEHGDGTRCQEDDSLPWPAGPTCTLSGRACYNTIASSGGGGTTSGGGGDTCRYENGYCAPWCSGCSQYGGG